VRRGWRVGTALAVAALVLLVVAGAAYLTWPLTSDQGTIANVGRVWLEGGVPYRDVWEPKGPSAALSFAFVELIFGRSEPAVRAVDLALLAAAAALFGMGVARSLGRRVGWAVGLLYPVVVLQLGDIDLAQPDAWIAYVAAATLPWIVAADAGHQRGRAARVALIAFATCVAYASLFKPFYPVIALLPAGSAVAFGRGWRVVARRVGLCAAVTLAGVGVAVGYFAAVGALDRFFEVYLWYSSAVYARLAPSGRVGMTARQLGAFFFVRSAVRAQLACAAVGVWVLRRTQPRLLAFVLGWLALALALVALQHKYYGYHYHLAFPPLALLAAAGAVECAEAIRTAWDGWRARSDARVWHPARALAAAIALVALAVPLAAKLLRNDVRFVTALLGARSGRGPLLDRIAQGDEAAVGLAHRRLARRLLAAGRPCTVASWSYASTYAWLGDCRFASRFIFNGPLVYAAGSDITRRYREEFLAALRDPRGAPNWVVVDSAYAGWAGPAADWRGFPEFRAIVDSAYRPVRGEGSLLLFERRTRGVGVARAPRTDGLP
jgi:hypothetical protein